MLSGGVGAIGAKSANIAFAPSLYYTLSLPQYQYWLSLSKWVWELKPERKWGLISSKKKKKKKKKYSAERLLKMNIVKPHYI